MKRNTITHEDTDHDNIIHIPLKDKLPLRPNVSMLKVHLK